MQIRENQAWSTEVPQAVQTQGQLCPAQRRMPQFGSLLTEAVVASILFVRMPFNVILNGVYTFNQWTLERGDECPLITRGHSALLTACGSNAFSLKSFFDSCTRVNQILFRSISIVTRAFKGMPGSAMPITFINGVKMYGENSMDPLAKYILGAPQLQSVAFPLDKLAMDALTSAMRMPGYLRIFVAFASPLAWADFMFHFVVDLIYRIVRAVFTGMSPEFVFYTTMYDFEEQFAEIVTAR